MTICQDLLTERNVINLEVIKAGKNFNILLQQNSNKLFKYNNHGGLEKFLNELSGFSKSLNL